MKSPIVSILGDSISTFEGCNPPQYEVYYRDSVKYKNNVLSPSDTWWYQVIEKLNGSLCINDSYSGSKVAGHSRASGNNSTRTYGLHVGAIMPDTILIYMGLNDWACGVPIGDYSGNGEIPMNITSFRTAYATMLKKVHDYYKEARIWCATLCKAKVTDEEEWLFPIYNASMISLDEYNDAIRQIAPNYGAALADIAASNTPYETVDGAHPDKKGMRTLASLWLECLSPNATCDSNTCV